jgi:hypothetical protein
MEGLNMENLATLSIQAVAWVVTVICFAQIKMTFLKIFALIPVIVCGLIFCFNFFSNFAGV